MNEPTTATPAATISTSGAASVPPAAGDGTNSPAPVAAPAPSAASATSPQPPAGGDWRANISKEFRDHSSMKDFKDVDSLAKSYVHAQSMIGADKVVIPKEDDPKLWGPVYDKLGRPKTPDEYKLPEVKMPEGITINKEHRDGYMKQMHDLGLSQKQAAGLYEHFMGQQSKQFEAMTVNRNNQTTQGIESLKTEWGDNFQTNVNHAVLAVKKFGSDEARSVLDQTGLGNHPALVKMFAKVGAGLAEDSAAGDGGGQFTSEQEHAVGVINGIKEDKDAWAALNDRSNPQHKIIKDKWVSAHLRAYPGKQKE